MSKINNVFEISPKDFTALEKVLSDRLPTSGLMYNVLKLGQKLQGLGGNQKITVSVFADKLPAEWEKDNVTFMGVSNVVGLPQNLVVFSAPKTGSSKETIQHLLDALDWGRQNQFEGVETHITPIVLEKANRLGKVQEHDLICIYHMTREFALEILNNDDDQKALANPSLRISSLKPSDASIVQDRWPEKREGYLNMIQASIELCSSGGVYISTNDSTKNWQPVSFAVQLPFGSIHALHTEPEHRRKGYGKLTMKMLAQNIAKDERIPLVQIYKTNDNSLSLNEGVGFKYSHDINLIHFTPKQKQ